MDLHARTHMLRKRFQVALHRGARQHKHLEGAKPFRCKSTKLERGVGVSDFRCTILLGLGVGDV